jgi:predicted phage terminase large subunit-like protein
MADLGDKAKERFLRETQPPEVEGVKIDWSKLPHPAIRDLRGMRFGKLVVKAYSYTREQANGIPCVYWKCQCDCGNEHDVSRDHLVRTGTKSCGCLSVVGNKGVKASAKTAQRRSHYRMRERHGLPPVPPTEVIGDPADVFAYDSLMAYACLQWAGYIPAAHHHLIARYLEQVEKGKIKRLMIFLPPRHGKLVADSTPIETAERWTTHGNLKVGDFVYGLDERPIKVLAVSKKDYATLIVEFSNGEKIKCHENHEWSVWYHSQFEKTNLYDSVETKDIKVGLSLGIKYSLPKSPATPENDVVEIISIQDCEPELGHCIQVDTDDGLYLVGETCIPTHNSMIISEFFPAWFLGRNPDKRVVCASYGQELASEFGRKVRNQIADPLYGCIFPGVGLAGDSAASDKFDMSPPHRGGYVAVGAGGALTGRGANCFVAGTKILTNQGNINIEDLILSPRPVKILSFNIEERAIEYQEMQAFKSRSGHGIYRVTTSTGRMVEVTGDHPIFVSGKGYIAANKLAAGDSVVCAVQKGICATGIRDAEAHEKRSQGYLLFSRMFGIASRNKEQTSLSCMRESSRKERQKVLQWLSSKARRTKRGISASTDDMPNLQHSVYGKMARSWAWKICAVLQQALFGDWSFIKNDGGWKPALDSWANPFTEPASLRTGLPNNETFNFTEGRQYLRFLRREAQETTCPSFGRKADQQLVIESSDSLCFVSSEDSQGNGFWTGYDKVESVIRVREAATVYDIQVKKNHNLFANGILCHNCLIIDDILKNSEEADSETHRRKLIDWYTSVAYTRLMDDGAIVLVMTRWHVADLAGHLLKEHKHEKWKVLNLPAINEQGEALWPERFSVPTLEQIKKTLPARHWEALYQQRPFVEEGSIFKRQWWKMWPDTKPIPECEFIIQSWDTSFSEKEEKTSDFNARVTLGVFRRPDDECHNVMLLEAWKGRVDYADLRKEALRAYQDYEPDKVIVEKKSSGPILIQDLRRSGLPIAQYTPAKDKITRAYAAQSLLENGRVYYPSRQWAEDFITSLAQFPHGSHDDEVDAFTQAIIWLQQSFLVAHSDDAKRRKIEDGDDEDLPENVVRLHPRKESRKKAAYG